ncbi:hypothetical protein CONLIGDRAFT_680261 [Coniochaeta ligniaria NRRL 30616]|uniref:Uncharacterized protein n=1 Tax=Coniochaeta ligniaria NRRL 30616 TaxID=1408157 RepID=A0A1J7JJG5_9PEZI|nr:hypothetical protein CONLIGDRAFT_680261 [Coniochaeta ligniaria NRRL 30616]
MAAITPVSLPLSSGVNAERSSSSLHSKLSLLDHAGRWVTSVEAARGWMNALFGAKVCPFCLCQSTGTSWKNFDVCGNLLLNTTSLYCQKCKCAKNKGTSCKNFDVCGNHLAMGTSLYCKPFRSTQNKMLLCAAKDCPNHRPLWRRQQPADLVGGWAAGRRGERPTMNFPDRVDADAVYGQHPKYVWFEVVVEDGDPEWKSERRPLEDARPNVVLAILLEASSFLTYSMRSPVSRADVGADVELKTTSWRGFRTRQTGPSHRTFRLPTLLRAILVVVGPVVHPIFFLWLRAPSANIHRL